MRNLKLKTLRFIFFAAVLFATVGAAVVFQKQWKASAQGGMVTFTTYMYPFYEFNTLNGPTGLLLLKPQTGGSTYFHLFISDTGNHVVRKFTPTIGYLDTIAGSIGTP